MLAVYLDLKEFNQASVDTAQSSETGIVPGGEEKWKRVFGGHWSQFCWLIYPCRLIILSPLPPSRVTILADLRLGTSHCLNGVASLIMRVMVRYLWLSYFGLFFLIYLAVTMLYDGFVELGLVPLFLLGETHG